jgi:hypothetical protein
MSASFAIGPARPPYFLNQFRETLRRDGSSASRTRATLLDSDETRREELFYIPFEHLNATPKLVLVGITPGPNQINDAYSSVQADLIAGEPDATILAKAKSHGAFSGSRMRPNLLKMLRAFDFETLLGIADVADLWGSASGLLHATSVVPHAAFLHGKPFAGSFEGILNSRVFKESFTRDFAASLPLISADALYVALGKTPLDALNWCAAQGLLRREQILGAFAHPSSSGGSRVGIYLGEKLPGELDSDDPVRRSADWLIAAAEQMRNAVVARGCVPRAGSPVVAPAKPIRIRKGAFANPRPTAVPSKAMSPAEPRTGPYAIVKRGPSAGTVLLPHEHDGFYVVSPDRYEKNYIRVPVGEPLEPFLARGLKLRMSAPGHPSSLIAPASILGRQYGT